MFVAFHSFFCGLSVNFHVFPLFFHGFSSCLPPLGSLSEHRTGAPSGSAKLTAGLRFAPETFQVAHTITVSTAEMATGPQGAGVGLATVQPMTKTSTKVPRAWKQEGNQVDVGSEEPFWSCAYGSRRAFLLLYAFPYVLYGSYI